MERKLACSRCGVYLDDDSGVICDRGEAHQPRTHVWLDDAQMQELQALCTDMSTKDQMFDPLIKVWMMVVGQEVWEEADVKSLVPWEWALPTSQTQEILRWWAEAARRLVPGTDVAVHVNLEWMNKGPSSFEEAVV